MFWKSKRLDAIEAIAHEQELAIVALNTKLAATETRLQILEAYNAARVLVKVPSAPPRPKLKRKGEPWEENVDWERVGRMEETI